MRVKTLIPRSGPAGAFGVGEVIDLPDAEAKALVEAGKAEPVRSAKPKRAATAEPPERPD